MSSKKRGFLAAFRNAGSGKRVGRTSKRVMVTPNTGMFTSLEHDNAAEEEEVILETAPPKIKFLVGMVEF
jgi:hypothetical protein